jgi:hypothetical protein
MTKQVHYWAAQEQRWHDKWLESQKMIDELETALRQVEDIALRNIPDEGVRVEITKIVDQVWRGAR